MLSRRFAVGSKQFLNVLERQSGSNVAVRAISVTASRNESESWLSKLLMVRKIDTGKEAHSRLLSDTEKVYELFGKFSLRFSWILLNSYLLFSLSLTVHDVKPKFNEDYLEN